MIIFSDMIWLVVYLAIYQFLKKISCFWCCFLSLYIQRSPKALFLNMYIVLVIDNSVPCWLSCPYVCSAFSQWMYSKSIIVMERKYNLIWPIKVRLLCSSGFMGICMNKTKEENKGVCTLLVYQEHCKYKKI